MENCNSSMQMTRAADYAVRVLIHLAGLAQHRRLSLSALAHATSTPPSFLSKVLQALVRSGYIASHRGQGGGFEITAAGRDASVREVIEAVEGPIHLNVCLDPDKACSRKSWCPAHPVWARAQRAMLDELEAALIVDLAACPSFVNVERAS
jgi:Rrf2 family protein